MYFNVHIYISVYHLFMLALIVEGPQLTILIVYVLIVLPENMIK